MVAVLDSLKALLGHPRVYVLSQHLSGGAAIRRRCLKELDAKRGERILDIGCGPAYYLPWLDAGVEYWGFDTEARYIKSARERFGARANFTCEIFSDAHLDSLPRFDGVLLLGLLHHLDDGDADALLARVGAALAHGGRVVTLDTCFDDRLTPLARIVARHDRGQYVRSTDDFTTMARKHFASVDGRLIGEDMPLKIGLWRMVLRVPVGATTAQRP